MIIYNIAVFKIMFIFVNICVRFLVFLNAHSDDAITDWSVHRGEKSGLRFSVKVKGNAVAEQNGA